MKAILILTLLSILLICAGCGERRVKSDGKPWLADREEYRSAPTDPDNHLLADMQDQLDAGPLADWSR